MARRAVNLHGCGLPHCAPSCGDSAGPSRCARLPCRLPDKRHRIFDGEHLVMNWGTYPGGLIIRQPERGYRFSIDSVILGGVRLPLLPGCRPRPRERGAGSCFSSCRASPPPCVPAPGWISRKTCSISRAGISATIARTDGWSPCLGTYGGRSPGSSRVRSTWWCRTRRTAGRGTGVGIRIGEGVGAARGDLRASGVLRGGVPVPFRGRPVRLHIAVPASPRDRTVRREGGVACGVPAGGPPPGRRAAVPGALLRGPGPRRYSPSPASPVSSWGPGKILPGSGADLPPLSRGVGSHLPLERR